VCGSPGSSGDDGRDSSALRERSDASIESGSAEPRWRWWAWLKPRLRFKLSGGEAKKGYERSGDRHGP